MTLDKKRNKPRRPPAGVFVGLLVAVLGVGIWWLSQNISGVTRGEPPVPTVNLLPPPPPAPPPPPPPPEKPPEPDKIDPPKSDQPKADEPKQLTIAGPAQAGSDQFGLQHGNGDGNKLDASPGGQGNDGGPDEGGFAEASYSRYAGSAIQRAVQADNRLSHQVFSAEVSVWIDATGHPTRVAVQRSTGDKKLDQQLVATLEHMSAIDERPPSKATGSIFLVRTNIRGSRG